MKTCLEQDMSNHIRLTLCKFLYICHVQWQELTAELEEHQKENLALCDKIKRSRQAITAEIIEQRGMKRSFHNASTQLKKRIRYSLCFHLLRCKSTCLRKVVLFLTHPWRARPLSLASGPQPHVLVISASSATPMLHQGNAQIYLPLAARFTSTHA